MNVVFITHWPGQYGEYGGYDFLLIKVVCPQLKLTVIIIIKVMMMIIMIITILMMMMVLRWRVQCQQNWLHAFHRLRINPHNLILEVMAGDLMIMMVVVVMVGW